MFEDRVASWLDQGAIPSDTVGSLLTQIGFTEKYLRSKKGQDTSEMVLRTTIKERPKKTRKMKKAAITAPETPTEPAEETPAETTKEAESTDQSE